MPRETYTVTFKDGHRQTFDGPPGMSDADLVQRARQERKFQGGDIATSFAGGATRHLLEDEPQTVNALLGGALTASGAGAPVAAAVPFVTSGLKRLSQLLATGKADPVTGGELTQDAIEGAIGGYGGAAVAKGARAVGATKEAVGALADRYLPRGVMGGLLRFIPKATLVDAATSKPVLGAAEAVGEGLTPEGIRGAFGSVGRGLMPGLADEAPSVSAGILRRTTRPSAAMRDYAQERAASLEALKRQMTTGTGTGVPADLPGPSSYEPFLQEIDDAVTAARPTPPGTLGEPTGWPAQPPGTGADYPSWLRRVVPEPPPPPSPPASLVPTGTGTPPAPAGPSSYDPFLQRLEDVTRPAAPPAGFVPTGTGVPPEIPPGGASYDAFLRQLEDAVPKPAPVAPAVAPAAPDPVAVPDLPAWMRRPSGTRFAPSIVEAAEPEAGTLATAASEAAPQATAAVRDQGAARAARAARTAAELDAPVTVTDEQQALLEKLLDSPSFRALRRTTE